MEQAEQSRAKHDIPCRFEYLLGRDILCSMGHYDEREVLKQQGFCYGIDNL